MPLSNEDIEQIKGLITTSSKPLADSIATMATAQAQITKDLGVVADTLKALPPATPANKDDVDPKDKVLTREDVEKLADERADAKLAARDDAATKKAARQASIDKIVKEKLGGNAELGKLLVGDDEAAIAASADTLAGEVKKFKPDFGGAAAKDGGTVPNGDAPPAPVNANLSPGVAKFAASMKLPA